MRVYLKSYSSEKCLSGSEESSSQYFYHSDHLGSAQLVTNQDGEVYQRIEYTPYGETWIDMRTNITALYDVPYRFTAKELDKETGLYYYGARYLDPKYSRWISTDPALGEYIPAAGKANAKDMANLPGMGGIFNHTNAGLFHYAGNCPIRYIDPDGRELRKCYLWVWLKGFRIVNDNGTGSDKTDDRIVAERIAPKPYSKSETSFESYDEACRDAQDHANEYSFEVTGPSIEYHFDENDEDNNYFEINILTNLAPNGDGSTNESYEVNRWVIIEEEQ
jgi:RHS repeat-associated protein